MRAIAIEEFGGSDKLQVVDLPTPEPGSDEVLIRVHAAGVGPWDVMSRQGVFGNREFPFVPGFEPAGVVEAVGDDVEDLSEGDEVFAYRFPGGGYGEYVTASQGITARKPASLSFEETAGVPVAGTTAHQGLVDELGVQGGGDGTHYGGFRGCRYYGGSDCGECPGGARYRDCEHPQPRVPEGAWGG